MNAPVIAEGIHARVKELLDQRGWSARKLSMKAGLCPSYVSVILGRPGATPSAETIQSIAAAAGCSAMWLATGRGDTSPVSAPISERIEALLNEMEESAIDGNSADVGLQCIRWRRALRDGTFTGRAPALVADLVRVLREDAESAKPYPGDEQKGADPRAYEGWLMWALERCVEATAILAALSAPSVPSAGEVSR